MMRTIRRLTVAAAALLACGAVLLHAGGFFLGLDKPANTSTAAGERDIYVRAYGCAKPEQAKLTATAEGLMGNARKSLPLQVTPTSESGLFLIRNQWPAEGNWVVVVTGANGSLKSSLLVDANRATQTGSRLLAPPNSPESAKAGQRIFHRTLAPAEIDATLAMLAKQTHSGQ